MIRVYCTCGQRLVESESRRKCRKLRLDALSIPNCVIKKPSHTITVCRWFASETNPADEPPRPKRYRPRMHSDFDQYETSSTGLITDCGHLQDSRRSSVPDSPTSFTDGMCKAQPPFASQLQELKRPTRIAESFHLLNVIR